MKPNVLRSKSFAKDAADLIVKKATESLDARGRFILGLCGGKTPEPVYTELVNRREALNWNHVFITFGDERCVKPENTESNFRMAKESLLDGIEIPPQNIYRVHGEEPPDEAAAAYEKQLLLMCGDSAGIVRHDLLLLGMGAGGRI